MIHQHAALVGDDLVVGVEGPRDGIGLRFGTAQADEARVKSRNVGLQQLRRIALRIYRDEQCLDARALGAEQPAHFGEFGQSRGANVGAVRVAKGQQYDLAAIIGQRALLPARVGKREIRVPMLGTDVAAMKRRTRWCTEPARGQVGQQQDGCQGQQREGAQRQYQRAQTRGGSRALRHGRPPEGVESCRGAGLFSARTGACTTMPWRRPRASSTCNVMRTVCPATS